MGAKLRETIEWWMSVARLTKREIEEKPINGKKMQRDIVRIWIDRFFGDNILEPMNARRRSWKESRYLRYLRPSLGVRIRSDKNQLA